MKVTLYRDSDGDRPSSWVVRYYLHRNPKRKFFKTKSEAEEYAKRLREQLRAGGNIFDPASAQHFTAGSNHDSFEPVCEGLENKNCHGIVGNSNTATFAKGCDLVVSRATDRARRSNTIAGYRQKFQVLKKTFGPRLASSIQESEVQPYLDSLTGHWGRGKASVYTQKSILGAIRMALRAVCVFNPLRHIVLRFPESREIDYFRVEEVRRLLTAARPHERGMLALAIFAGLRPERLGELPPECVNVLDKTIRVPGALTKTHRPIFLETVIGENGHDQQSSPLPILWAWLEAYPFQPSSWSKFQARIKRYLGRRWVQDGCRHTAATYCLAKFGAEAAARLLDHQSLDMLKRHYGGLASREAADEFFKLGPDSVGAPPADRRCRVPWPPKEELARLVQKWPLTLIARQLRCSDVSVLHKCRQLGIPNRRRGGWTKEEFLQLQTSAEFVSTGNPLPAGAGPQTQVVADTGSTLAPAAPNPESESNRLTTDRTSDDSVRLEKPLGPGWAVY